MSLLKSHIQNLSVVLLSGLTSIFVSCNRTPEPTYADIEPIIQKNCVPCHKSGGGGPFPLVSYEEVKKKAKTIVAVTGAGYMPPWPADRNYTHFINERGLSDEEISKIKKWYEEGCERGATRHDTLKYTVTYPMGKPDMILDMPPVTIHNNNRDKFYVIKIPYEIPEQRYVRAVEFVPGQPAYAHHMNGHYLRFSEQTNPFAGFRIADLESDSFEYQFKKMQLTNIDGSVPERIHSAVNYLPGAFGIKYPKGIGGFVMSRKGAFVANDMHYGPSRKNVVDSSKLLIYFSDIPPQRPTFELMLGTNGVSPIEPPLQVAPNTVSKHITKVTIYNDISVLTVNPHMHLLGTRFKAYALKPNGDTVKLIHIPVWRFRWQYFYTFTHPVKIPRGSTIVVEAEFDNTRNNPNNPFNPPRLIGERLDRGGASMRTTDEMLQFIITYMPYQKGDEKIDLSIDN